MKTVTPNYNREVVELAGQIVSDYPDWGVEHVAEMIDCGDEEMDYDELCSACHVFSDRLKAGEDFDAILESMSATDVTLKFEISVNQWAIAVRDARGVGLSLTKTGGNGGVTYYCTVKGDSKKAKRFRTRHEY